MKEKSRASLSFEKDNSRDFICEEGQENICTNTLDEVVSGVEIPNCSMGLVGCDETDIQDILFCQHTEGKIGVFYQVCGDVEEGTKKLKNIFEQWKKGKPERVVVLMKGNFSLAELNKFANYLQDLDSSRVTFVQCRESKEVDFEIDMWAI